MHVVHEFLETEKRYAEHLRTIQEVWTSSTSNVGIINICLDIY
jgi:hypothetical protein